MRWRDRLLIIPLLLAIGCASGDPNVRPVRVEGVVTNIDLARQTLHLSVGTGEKRHGATVRFTSLTIVDREEPGARIEDIQFGEYVVIIGHQDIESDEIIADRIGPATRPDRLTRQERGGPPLRP